MAWVRSEYASEFAVLSAWLSMVLPWNLVYHSSVPTNPVRSEMGIIRLSIVELQFRFPGRITGLPGGPRTARNLLEEMYPGMRLFQDVYVVTPIGSGTHYSGYLQWGSLAWALGAFALLLSFAFSLAFYLREDELTDRLSADPVRIIGGLLGVATLALSAASVLYFFERDLVGIPIPLGLLVMGALSTALLRAERT